MSQPLHLAQITSLSRAPHLPKLARLAMKFAVLVTTWDNRWRSRRQLARLDCYLFDDLGLTRHQAQREALRPLWED